MPMPGPRHAAPAVRPAGPGAPPAPRPAEAPMMGEGEEGEAEEMEMPEGGMPGMGDLGQIRQRLAENPAYLQQLLTELQTSNPQLFQLVQQNPQILLQLLMGGGGAQAPRPHGGIQVTPEEKAAIDRVNFK